MYYYQEISAGLAITMSNSAVAIHVSFHNNYARKFSQMNINKNLPDLSKTKSNSAVANRVSFHKSYARKFSHTIIYQYIYHFVYIFTRSVHDKEQFCSCKPCLLSFQIWEEIQHHHIMFQNSL